MAVLTVELVRLVVVVQFVALEQLVVEPAVLLVPVWFALALVFVLLMLPVSHRRSYSVLGLTVLLVAAMVLSVLLLVVLVQLGLVVVLMVEMDWN